jgi:HEAT repeat protein
MQGRGKRIAAASVLMGSAVLALAAYAGRGRILEEYYLWKLDHPPGARVDYEDDDKRIEHLGELRSLRAVPRILEHLKAHSKEKSPPPCMKLCIDALASPGAPAVPHLVQGFEGARYFSAMASMLALGRIGEAARESIPPLLKRLRSPEDALRRYAAIVLGLIGSPEVGGPLRQTMSEDEDPYVRGAAAFGLLQMGSKGEDALVQMLKNAPARERAIEALGLLVFFVANSPSTEEWIRLRVRELPPGLKQALAEAAQEKR